MQIEISARDEIPIYRQIVRQVTYLIASGSLSPNQELPAIRALSQRLLVTPNTVAKAYRELETAGLVYKRRGAGTYVAESKSPLARGHGRKILAQRVDELLADAHRLNFNHDQVLQLIEERRQKLRQKWDREDRRA